MANWVATKKKKDVPRHIRMVGPGQNRMKNSPRAPNFFEKNYKYIGPQFFLKKNPQIFLNFFLMKSLQKSSTASKISRPALHTRGNQTEEHYGWNGQLSQKSRRRFRRNREGPWQKKKGRSATRWSQWSKCLYPTMRKMFLLDHYHCKLNLKLKRLIQKNSQHG